MEYSTEARQLASARYRERNRAKVNAASAAWRSEHGTKIDRKFYEKHTDKILSRVSSYSKNNRPLRNAINARYRAQKLKATPLWVNHDLIAEIYNQASIMKDECGKVYHVDHIVPLQGETVCGLHVEYNLQILKGKLNLSKQNRFWPNMPSESN